jgi:uncharacterized damage-inducible protein DinB
MLPSDLQPLMRHMEWADALVWSAVLALPAERADPLTRERLHHVHWVQHAYLRIWRQEPVDAPPPVPAELGVVLARARELYPAAAGFLGSIEASELERRVEFPWREHLRSTFGEVHPTTLAEAVLQVALHSTYHRGQINARLRELGGEPPLVDFIVWVWAGKPEPRWASAAADAGRPA